MTKNRVTLHGTSLLVGTCGVLLMGRPGSGKSSLALRMIDEPGYGTGGTLIRSSLISDDQTVITRAGTALVMTAPAALRGKLEVRGLGIANVAFLSAIELCLVINLVAHANIERLPDEKSLIILGLNLPLVEIDGLSSSAPARLRAAVSGISGQRGELRGNAVGGYVGAEMTELSETDSNV